ncbi:MAG TPA: hypothetical protein VGR93_02325 [Candidatus Acidoferrales bacterium]|nr:hypothetical protein [Candidatus Acidoferrales bacterium]
MKIVLSTASLRELTSWECAIRFIAGGSITVAAGLIAKTFGPGVGGLFLAFPAILPASVTMIANHERQRKEEAGLRGVIRGREAAGADAAGAAMGGIALCLFAIVVWQALPHFPSWAVLIGATGIWFGVAFGIWRARKAIKAR